MDNTSRPVHPVPRTRGSTLPRPWQPEELGIEDRGLRPASHALLAAVAAFMVLAVVWASLAQVDEVTRGEGRIITVSQTQSIQNMEGGILAQIVVREGELVEKGQVLFRIDPTRHASDFQGAQQEARALSVRIARLAAEAQRTPFEVPEEIGQAAPALAAEEAALYRARQADLDNKTAILRDQVTQRRQELVELRGRAERLDEALGFLLKEIALTAPLAKAGVVSEVELLRLERESARVRVELDGARLAMPRVEAAISEARRKQQDTELAFRSQAAAELAEAKARLAKLAESLPALHDRVQRAEVRAPVRGVVKAIASRTVGGVVAPGAAIAELVPVDESLLAEVKVRPGDIAFVFVGQRALVKVVAYDFSIYGGLPGTVSHVSPDALQPPQGEAYFVAHVRTDSSSIAFRGRQLAIMPGMTVEADLLTGRKSVLDYLLKPVNRARERALRER